MSEWIKLKIVQLFCRHKKTSLDGRFTGKAVLNWAFRPDHEYRIVKTCDDCNKILSDKAGSLYGYKRKCPERYNARGWPVDGSGRELVI